MNNPTQIASHLLRSRLGKLCVAITGATSEEICEKAAVVLKETSFLEFRLDYLPKPLAALPALKKFLDANGAATVIATCRCKANGGRFTGTAAAALEVLMKAAESGFAIVDVELESMEKLPKNTMEKLREAGAAVIISWHDFTSTPKDLDGIYNRMAPFAPDFMKVVPTAKSLSDNITLMKFLSRMEDRSNSDLVGICMGEAGVISRVLGLRAGSSFTFAAASAGEETAPGQITARTLIETYRIETVDAATKVYGVAGNPIGSSMSPLMLNTAFRRETVNAVYLALQTSKVDDLFKLMREIPIQGLSITMPLKQDIMPLLERTDPLSAKIGAVNTILRAQDGKFYGFNTDVAGIVGPLERRLSLKDKKVLVLGAGGAARAAVFGCRDKGAEVFILNRTPETAQKLARQSGAKTIKRDAVAKTGFDVIINATPAGMLGNKTASLLGPEDLNCRLVFDLVYNPIETPLLRMARQKGIAVISGVEMFVHQGARQFEIWTGKPAPDQEMLKVVIHSLRQGIEGAAGSLDPSAAAPKLDRVAEPVVEAEPEPVAAPGKSSRQSCCGEGCRCQSCAAYTCKGCTCEGRSRKSCTRESRSCKACACGEAGGCACEENCRCQGCCEKGSACKESCAREEGCSEAHEACSEEGGCEGKAGGEESFRQASRKEKGQKAMMKAHNKKRIWPQLFAAVFFVALPLWGQADDKTPAANPARPTYTNPATLPPVGYLQFEQGYLGSLDSPETTAQYGVNQVTKLAVHPRLLLQVQTQPYAASKAVGDTAYTNGSGDVILGAQAVLWTPTSSNSSDPTSQADKKTPVPTISLGYLGRVHSGTTGDIDIGSYSNGLVLLLSGDVGGFHYDTNYLLNEQPGTGFSYSPGPAFLGAMATPHTVRRAQFAQTLSVNHSIVNPNLQLSVELYHLSQPFVTNDDDGHAVKRANLVDLLFAPSYQIKPNFIVDLGFSRGLTSTSTRWQSFAGFTYLLPHRLWPEHKAK